MKVWAREYLANLDEDERYDFLNSLPPNIVWQMAEGNPENKTDLKVKTDSKYTEEELLAAKEFIVSKLNKKDE